MGPSLGVGGLPRDGRFRVYTDGEVQGRSVFRRVLHSYLQDKMEKVTVFFITSVKSTFFREPKIGDRLKG